MLGKALSGGVMPVSAVLADDKVRQIIMLLLQIVVRQTIAMGGD